MNIQGPAGTTTRPGGTDSRRSGPRDHVTGSSSFTTPRSCSRARDLLQFDVWDHLLQITEGRTLRTPASTPLDRLVNVTDCRRHERRVRRDHASANGPNSPGSKPGGGQRRRRRTWDPEQVSLRSGQFSMGTTSSSPPEMGPVQIELPMTQTEPRGRDLRVRRPGRVPGRRELQVFRTQPVPDRLSNPDGGSSRSS